METQTFYHAIKFDKMHKIQIGPAHENYRNTSLVFFCCSLHFIGNFLWIKFFLMDVLPRQMVGALIWKEHEECKSVKRIIYDGI